MMTRPNLAFSYFRPASKGSIQKENAYKKRCIQKEIHTKRECIKKRCIQKENDNKTSKKQNKTKTKQTKKLFLSFFFCP